VIEDIGPEVNLDSVPYYQKLLGLVPTPFANRAEAKEFLLHQFVRLAKNYENPEALAQYFYANMADQPDGRVDWRFWKPGILESVEARNSDRWQDVKSLKVPTLLIRGGDSRDLKPEIYQEMLDANKMIKGVVIPQAGHWVHSDQPQAVIAALKDFVGGF
jgi:pimeloyl-ACP methyl ester carboxylesterase